MISWTIRGVWGEGDRGIWRWAGEWGARGRGEKGGRGGAKKYLEGWIGSGMVLGRIEKDKRKSFCTKLSVRL